MKTNFKTETGINIQKTISKSLAVVTSIALISISLNAQDLDYSLFEKISFNKNPLAMIHTSTKTSLESTTVNALAALTETETEDALQLEDWMMNENNFSTNALVETEAESPMELESWMTDEDLFSTQSTVDQPLELENWMISEVIWK